MELYYKFEVDNRMRAILSVKNSEKFIRTSAGNTSYITVKIDIPNDYIIKFPQIEVDSENNLLIRYTNYNRVHKPTFDDNGNIKIKRRIYSDGSVSDKSCEFDTELIYISDLIDDYIESLIFNDLFCEPVNLTSIFSEIIEWETLMKDSEHLLEEAEKIRKTKYDEQVSMKKLNELAERKKREDREEKMYERFTTWVNTHGSDVLKNSVVRGYDCSSRFLIEWGRHIFNEDYTLDFKGEVCSQSRTCPSEVAINELIDIENRLKDIDEDVVVTAQIVWIPERHSILCDSGEAIEVVLHGGAYFHQDYYFYNTF